LLPNFKDFGNDSFETEHQIEEYDIIVMASNGVWDNMFNEDIIKCIEENMPSRS
jgi:serine/threonine protein phosphatase PrpC